MKYSVQYYSSLSVDFMVPFVGFSDNKQLIIDQLLSLSVNPITIL